MYMGEKKKEQSKVSTNVAFISDCGSLTTSENGMMTSTGTTYNSSAVFVCNDGYDMNGTNTTSCQADGNWTTSEPTCVIQGNCSHCWLVVPKVPHHQIYMVTWLTEFVLELYIDF